MTPSEAHNRLTSEIIMRVGKGTHSMPELMTVLESVILSAMLINIKVYGCAPATSTSLVEAAIQRATERLAEKINSER